MDFYRLKSILRYDHPQKCSKINEILRASSPHGYQALVFYGSGLISRSFTLIRAVEITGFFFSFIFSPLFPRFPHSETTSIRLFHHFSSISDLFWRFEIFFRSAEHSHTQKYRYLPKYTGFRFLLLT